MSRIQEAQNILRDLALPSAQQNEMSALVLLALCGVRPESEWSEACVRRLTISKDIMLFMSQVYGRTYAPNTRETVRRSVLHQFVQAGIADYNAFEPGLPTNSPRSHYSVSQSALDAIRWYGTAKWSRAAAEFVKRREALGAAHQRRRARRLVPVRMPEGITVELPPGAHSELQADVLELLAPRFAPGAKLLYLADTDSRTHWSDTGTLSSIGLDLAPAEKLPDLVLLDRERNLVWLIEAAATHGPMTPKRVVELEAGFRPEGKELVFVTAFPDFATFRAHLRDIAWETEVWIAEAPDHLIHFDGEQFLSHHGP